MASPHLGAIITDLLDLEPRRIRLAHQARIEAYEADPHPLSVAARVSVISGQRKEARARGFVIESDEGEIVGGRNGAPSPLTYFVASIGFAVLTDLVRAFALHDISSRRIELDITAVFPVAKKYANEDVPISADKIRYTVEIDSDAPAALIGEAVRWAEEHCHAVHTVREPVTVEATYALNGHSFSPDP